MESFYKVIIICYAITSLYIGLMFNYNNHGLLKFIFYPMILIGRFILQVIDPVLTLLLGGSTNSSFWNGGK